jgi:hypothetical protein
VIGSPGLVLVDDAANFRDLDVPGQQTVPVV